jgi:hypothetical protein
VEGSCERSNEPSGSIKCWEVLEQLHNLRLLKKGSAPWSQLSEFLLIFFAPFGYLPISLRYAYCK